MLRLLVGGVGVGTAINVHEHEAVGIIGLLHNIKADDAGFLHAGAGVGERGGHERHEAFRFNLDVDMDDEHDGQIGQTRAKLKSGRHFADWRGTSGFAIAGIPLFICLFVV